MTVPHPPPISSFYVHLKNREFLANVLQSPHLPEAPFCCPHQTFILSLCLSEIITASPVIGRNTVMDVWCFCFRGIFFFFLFFFFFFFLLYLCIIHHHTTTTLFKESGLKQNDCLFFWKSLKALFPDWQLVLVRQLKLHYLKCEEMRAQI